MSQENVELICQMVDAGNRGDWTAWASGLHQEVEYFPLAENPQTEPVHGVDAALDFVADWLEPWEEYTVDVTRIVDAGDWVVIATQHSARHEMGAETSMEMHAAAAFRDRRIVELRWFINESDALDAAGLSE